MKVPIHKFLAAFSVGRLIRYGVVAFLGKTYGKQLLGFVSRYYEPILWVLIGLAVAGGIAATFYFIRRKQKGLPVFRSAKVPPHEKAA
jgi:membrane protein DedA with SNARE-associated domain